MVQSISNHKDGRVKPRWQLAIYDFNGTLINDGVLAHKCVEHIFKTLRPDISPPTYEEYKNEITSNFTQFYYDHGIPETVSGDEMNAIRTPYYEAHQTELCLNEGASKLLMQCWLFGIPNAIVSASPEDVPAMLRKFDVLYLFDKIRLKAWPKDEALIETLDYFGVKAEDTFYLDDTFDGISSARNLGMGTVGFTRGYNSRARILAAKPDFIVDSLYEVIDILKN